MNKEFFKRDALVVAKELLGKVLVREVAGERISGRIVETEAYIARLDKASHAYGERRTERVMPLYAEGGISYVYFIYGKYFCFNVITGLEGDAQGVLVRALEPMEGLEQMGKNRFLKSYSELTKRQKINLTSGPSKLCMALNIDRDMNKKNLMGDEIYIAEEEIKESVEEAENIKCNSGLILREKIKEQEIKEQEIEEQEIEEQEIEEQEIKKKCNEVKEIVECKRIGIDYAEEAIHFPWRFYINGNPYVSVRDKEAEEKLKIK